jgi:hypothetical protein
MAKCTQKTADHIYFDLTAQIIETANTAISCYFVRPTYQNMSHVEDTLIDLIPFAEITVNSCIKQKLVNAIRHQLSRIQTHGAIAEVDQAEILSHFETEAH